MNQLTRYEGRRALITGGGSGIGQATVLRVLAEGGRVVAADISEDGLKDTVAKAGDAADRLTTVVLNVADEASVRAGVAAAVEALGGLDVLVNAHAASCAPRTPTRRASTRSSRSYGSTSPARS